MSDAIAGVALSCSKTGVICDGPFSKTVIESRSVLGKGALGRGCRSGAGAVLHVHGPPLIGQTLNSAGSPQQEVSITISWQPDALQACPKA